MIASTALLDRAGIGHLLQAARLDDRARIGASVFRDDDRQHVLGDLAGDHAFADEIDKRGDRAGADLRLRDGLALRVGVSGEIAHDPIGDGLGVALVAAMRDGRLEIIGGLFLGDKDAGVIGRQPVDSR